MDTQLKELIDKIKNDGIKTAEQNAERIVSRAREQAAAIVKEAEENARNLRHAAQSDAEKFKESGQVALRQAGRDLILILRSDIEKMFNAILQQQTAKVLDANSMKEAVITAIKNLSLAESEGVEILIPEKEFDAVENGLKKELADQMAKGCKHSPSQGFGCWVQNCCQKRFGILRFFRCGNRRHSCQLSESKTWEADNGIGE